jgi:hypothetical protein
MGPVGPLYCKGMQPHQNKQAAVKSQDIISAGSALQTLVHQFSDPLSFYRELVQNALDAGSYYVDVQVNYTAQGQTEITVEDSGMGMTADIIDSQLTCLFSSQKDDDLTLIGKFGIGFVSVFALAPELVTVETARDGEAWRIDFSQDGSFERRRLDTPREGTKIRLLKTTTKEVYQDLKARSRSVLLYWCKHVNGEILFCGEHLERPFGIDVECPLAWSEPETEIQVGYSEDFHSFIGFYNQGLTLLESKIEHVFPGLVVKINSRFLEHTLTRDQVVEDEHFAKLMTRVSELVEDELSPKLFAELEKRDSGRGPICAALSAHFGARPLRTLACNQLIHPRGEAYSDHWIALPEKHPPGFICDGPSLVDLGDVKFLEVVFRLGLPADNYTSDELVVAEVGVATSPGKKVYLARQEVRVQDFDKHQSWTDVVLEIPYDRSLRPNLTIDWKGLVPLILKEIQLREPVARKREWSEAERQSFAFRTTSGKKATLATVLEAHRTGSLYLAPCETALTQAAENSNLTVLQAELDSAEWSLLRVLLDSDPRWLSREYVFPRRINHQVSRELVKSIKDLARSWGVDIRQVLLARSCCQQDWPALLVSETGALDRLEDTDCVRPGSWKTEKKVMLLNADEPRVERILRLAEEQTALAAFLLMKHFLSQRGLPEQVDATLALEAWKQVKV